MKAASQHFALHDVVNELLQVNGSVFQVVFVERSLRRLIGHRWNLDQQSQHSG
jgi:hypothetical protein